MSSWPVLILPLGIWRKTDREANVSAQSPAAGEEAWFPRADEHARRAAGSRPTPPARAATALRLSVPGPGRRAGAGFGVRVRELAEGSIASVDPRPEALPRSARIRRSSEVRRVLSRGAKGVSEYLVAFVTGRGPSRLAVVASRRVGGAVARARARRRLRELYRRSRARPAGDTVLVARRGADAVAWADLSRSGAEALERAERRRRRREGSP